MVEKRARFALLYGLASALGEVLQYSMAHIRPPTLILVLKILSLTEPILILHRYLRNCQWFLPGVQDVP
jgi:hypothetical protein